MFTAVSVAQADVTITSLSDSFFRHFMKYCNLSGGNIFSYQKNAQTAVL